MKIMKKIVKKIDNNSLIKSIRVIFLFFIFLFFVDSAMSATYTVTTTADSGAGSLRDAIAQANSTSEDDTIDFNITSGCSGGVCTITLTSGTLVINSASTAGSLTITNAGGSQRIEISGNNSTRVFSVNIGANLTIDSITIRDGSASNGGGINNSGGTVNITNSTITNNSASGSTSSLGGGIYNTGTVNITNSTITNNSASGSTSSLGGGIVNLSGGIVNITNSTITNNSATVGSSGGGIMNFSGGTVNVTNSTITNNSASSGGNGGGINNGGGTVNITNSTITNNSATVGGGGIRNAGTVNARNTIIANNNALSGPDFNGPLTSQGYNLIRNTSGTTITGVTTGNITGQDPLLTPLGYYGGSTWTRALFFESPALNAGSNCVRTAGACGSGQPSVAIIRDQRGASRQGFSRLVGAGPVDIGAYEFNPLYFAVLPDGTQNSSYSFVISQYSSSEGTFSFTMTGLPNGLSLQTQTSGSVVTVVITGTPTQSGFFQPQLSITSGSQTVTVSYAIKIGV
jgi:hypothetical protein